MSVQENNSRRNLLSVFILAVLGISAISLWQFFSFNDGKLHLVFCNVGQGDAVYLRTPNGKEALIDGGPDGKVLDCLSKYRPFYDQEIEVLISTHPQADHLAGLIPVLERYKVDNIFLENIPNQTAVFAKFRQLVAEEGASIYNPKTGDRVRLGETEINFYWPKAAIGDKKLWQKENPADNSGTDKITDLNDYALVSDIRYKSFISLQTSDVESPILSQISTLPSHLTVLKVPHHGSKIALSNDLLGKLSPGLAVISVGQNHFGHPAKITLDLLKGLGIETLRTDEESDIEIVSDGQVWQIKSAGRKSN